MIDLNEMFKQFNKQYQVEHKEMNHEQAKKTAKLILDEVHEFLSEFYTGAVFIANEKGGIEISFRGDVIDKPNLHNAAKELDDIRYITGQQMDQSGFDVDAIDAETHQSNMSKTITIDQIDYELEVAKKRYPHAVAIEVVPGVAVLRCTKTNKVIKPTTYEPAVITDGMIGR